MLRVKGEKEKEIIFFCWRSLSHIIFLLKKKNFCMIRFARRRIPGKKSKAQFFRKDGEREDLVLRASATECCGMAV